MSGTGTNGALGALEEALGRWLASRSSCCLEMSASSENSSCWPVNWSRWNRAHERIGHNVGCGH